MPCSVRLSLARFDFRLCPSSIADARARSPPPTALLVSGDQFAAAFSSLFTPIGGEYDLIGKNPQAEATIQNIGLYRGLMEELRTALSPEIELIDARVVGPGKELQEILKKIRKTITKREHKVSRAAMRGAEEEGGRRCRRRPPWRREGALR